MENGLSKIQKKFWASLKQPFPNSVAQKAVVSLSLVLPLLIIVAAPLTGRGDLFRGGGVAAISILSFVFFFQSDGKKEDRSQGLRRAIAGSTIVTFLVVLGLLTFSDAVRQTAGGSEIAVSLMSDFRWVVMTVVGFYFSSEMVSEYLGRSGSADAEKSTKPEDIAG